MRIEAIQEALHTNPFVPFRLVLPSDRVVAVPHPDFVSISPNRKWFIVWNKRGGMSWVEPALVGELAFNGARRH
jgi:hypothetical protein